jgi:integrase
LEDEIGGVGGLNMGVTVREKVTGSDEWWIFINHKGKRASKRAGSKRAAKESAVKIEKEIALERFNLETPEERRPLLFRQYAERWMKQHVAMNCKGATICSYRRALELYFLPVFGERNIREITREDVKSLCFGLKEKGLSLTTVKLRITILGTVFNAAIEDGILTANPAIRPGKIIKVPTNKGQVEFLTQEEFRRFLEAGKEYTPRMFPIFLTALRTGMRLGELLGLQWGDIDWNGKFIEVQRNIWRGVVTTPKNGKSRRIDMSNQLSSVLLEHRRTMAAEALAQGRPLAKWAFTSKQGNYLNATLVRKAFWDVLDKSKLRRFRFHDLRHSFASALIANGEPLAYVKDQMGHSSIQITVDVYGHLEPGANREAVNRLDDPLWNSGKSAPPAHLAGTAIQAIPANCLTN